MSFHAHDAVFTSHGIGAFEGHAAIHAFNQDWLASFEVLIGEIEEEVIALGDEVTLAVIVLNGRPLGSNGDRVRYAAVAEWTKGQNTRVMNYTNVGEASTAAERLAEETG